MCLLLKLFLNVLVVPVRFQHSFKDCHDQSVANLDHIFHVEPIKIASPSSDAEVALALRVLEGCCLLHRQSSVLAHQHKAIQDFEECNGIDEVALLIRDKKAGDNLRLKCREFLLLLIGHVSGRDRSPMLSIHDNIRGLLGEKCASLIWAASQFGSTLDPEHRLTALHIQARRVLESVNVY